MIGHRGGRSGPSATILVFAVLVMALPLLSGCVDVHRVREYFAPEGGAVLSYAARTSCIIEHTFLTDLNDPSTFRFQATNQTYVVAKTRWLKVSILLTMVQTDLPPNATALARLLGMDRHLNVELRRPSAVQEEPGQVIFAKHFNETDHYVSDEFLWPDEGYWVLAVEAQGVGTAGYRDEFHVSIMTYEPVRE